MEVQEHFYSDDPSRGPVDSKTTLRGVDYFFLGNGLIQAAVQVTAAEGATAVGLLVMDPERLGPKRTALTFDKISGISATALSLSSRQAPSARPAELQSGHAGSRGCPTRASRYAGGAVLSASRSFFSVRTWARRGSCAGSR